MWTVLKFKPSLADQLDSRCFWVRKNIWSELWRVLDIVPIIATYRPQDGLEKSFFDRDYLVAPQPENIAKIRELKSKFGEKIWYDFMIEYITQSKNWKSILSEKNLQENTLPYPIGFHLDKMSVQELELLLKNLNEILNNIKFLDIKKQLFLIRNHLMILIKESCFWKLT